MPKTKSGSVTLAQNKVVNSVKEVVRVDSNTVRVKGEKSSAILKTIPESLLLVNN